MKVRQLWMALIGALALVAMLAACENSQSTTATVSTTAITTPVAVVTSPTVAPSASPLATTAVGTTVAFAETPDPTATDTPAPLATLAPTHAPVTTNVPAAAEAPAPADLPALVPQNAPPTPASSASEVSHPSEPVRMIIQSIGLDLKPVAVGLDEQRVPVVPKHDVGWFTGSAMPGEGSNVVFWGHVLRWLDSPDIPAPFEHMHELQPGAAITIITADGQERQYHVTEQIRSQPDDTSLLYPTLGERLTLVSCIGDKVIRDGTLTKTERLVTIARLVR